MMGIFVTTCLLTLSIVPPLPAVCFFCPVYPGKAKKMDRRRIRRLFHVRNASPALPLSQRTVFPLHFHVQKAIFPVVDSLFYGPSL